MRAEFRQKRAISTRSIDKQTSSTSNLYRVGQTRIDKLNDKYERESPDRHYQTHDYWRSYANMDGDDPRKWESQKTQDLSQRETLRRSEFIDPRGFATQNYYAGANVGFDSMMFANGQVNGQVAEPEEEVKLERRVSDSDRLKVRRKDSALSKELMMLDRLCKADVEEVRVLINPPTSIIRLSTAIMLLVKPESILRVSTLETANLWNDCKIMMQFSTEFYDTLRNFKYMYVTRETYWQVKNFINANIEHFDVKRLTIVDKATPGLLIWL